MSNGGMYGDGRTYLLPNGWEPVAETTLSLATELTLEALRLDPAVKRLGAYYDPDGNYSGTTFLDAAPNEPQVAGAADLWAVATLSIPVSSRQGRRLMDDPATAGHVSRQLNRLPTDLPLTDLESPDGDGGPKRPGDSNERDHPLTLDVMWNLYEAFRGLLATETRNSQHWVFAAKLCARKRPLLFPVRDSLVCSYLSGGKPLGIGGGRLGSFSQDLQVFAWLITEPDVRSALAEIRSAMGGANVRVDDPELRLLDSALWTYAKWA